MKKPLLLLIITFVLFFSCKSKQIEGNRSMFFVANGESFIKEGFTEKNNWHLNFTNVNVNLTDINAISQEGKKIELHGYFWINLVEPSNDLSPIAKVSGVSSGNYQDLQFSISPQNDKYHDCSILLQGIASKDNRNIKFTIKINEAVSWEVPDGYVGEMIKGIVTKDRDGEEEITFHFDHLFGDINASKTDHVNTNSVGFDYFMQYEKNGVIDISQSDMKKDSDYEKFVKAIWSLGHSGEGHAKVIKTSSTFDN